MTCRVVGVGRSAKNSESKGTTMKKSSQNEFVGASAPAIPERVSVAMGEIAENMGEGLLALAVGAGLQVMAALMEADVTALARQKSKQREILLDYDYKKCAGCSICVALCPKNALQEGPLQEIAKGLDAPPILIDLDACAFCGMCVNFCPTKAFKMTVLELPEDESSQEAAEAAGAEA